MKNKQLIFLSGGGTAGHVYPNLALLPKLREEGIKAVYLGKKKSIEAALAAEAGLPFIEVNSERFHRDLSLKNLRSPFCVIQGIFQALSAVRKLRPGLIFCKGGFGSLPAAVAGYLTKTPVVLHESDMTPGLANRLCAPFAKRILVSFEDTLQKVPVGKGVFTGNPIRSSLLEGRREKGLVAAGFSEGDSRPVLLAMGGSQGAKALNEAVWSCAAALFQKVRVIHLYGNGQEGKDLEKALSIRENELKDGKSVSYYAVPYAKESLPDLLAAADVVLSRAGAGAINELLLLKKPSILVPLPTADSRGDQLLNAAYFEKRGFSKVLLQEELSEKTLLSSLEEVLENRESYLASMRSNQVKNGTEEVFRQIAEVLHGTD